MLKTCNHAINYTHGSVGGGVAQMVENRRLVIERLRNLGSTPDAMAR